MSMAYKCDECGKHAAQGHVCGVPESEGAYQQYRELGPNERIETGDEYCASGTWRPTLNGTAANVGLTPSEGMRYRRRVKAEYADVPIGIKLKPGDESWNYSLSEWVPVKLSPVNAYVTSGHAPIRRRVDCAEPPYATILGGHSADATEDKEEFRPERAFEEEFFNFGNAWAQKASDAVDAAREVVRTNPPVGCKPRFIWVEQRVGELSDAIGRYADDNRMDIEWVIELQEHLTWLKERTDESQGNSERHD